MMKLKIPERDLRKKKLVAYLRVSTKDQHLDNQRISINNFLKINKQYEVIQWFEEKKSAFSEREEFKKLLEILFSNPEIEGIIIQRLDRLGRSVKQLSQLLDEFHKNNKKLIVTEQNINTDTIEGKLLLNILSSIAQFESDLFKERAREGRIRYIKEKGRWGRYKIEIKPRTKAKIIALYKKGIGCHTISKILSVDNVKLSPMTIYRRLREWKIIKKKGDDLDNSNTNIDV